MKEKIYIFDLDDTLAESKTPLSHEMSIVLSQLLKRVKVAIVSGGSFEQYKKQVIVSLPQDREILKNLYLFPTNGSSMYQYVDGWKKVYSEELTKEEREKIINAINSALKTSGISFPEIFGEQIEDRESQVTFSALGQKAPVEKKKQWDPDQKIRLPLAVEIQKYLQDFEVRVGGTTSIDITRKGITKAYAIYKIMKHLGITKEEMLFFGDAIFPGGNDYAVKEVDVPCVKVKNYEDTLDHLREILKS